MPGFRGTASPPRPGGPLQSWRPDPPPRPIDVEAFATGHVLLRWDENLGRYLCLCGYDDRGIPKAARFNWDPEKKHWFTMIAAYAEKLIRYADLETAARLRPILEEAHASIAESRATDSDIVIPAPPGLAYMPFQRAGVAYALKRKSVLFGDAMGLGKTIQAIGVLNTQADPFPTLVVCPASLKINWRRELEKWLVKPCLPMLAGDWFPIASDVVIINYERLAKHARAIASRPWRNVIVDEAHFLKNPETIRSQQVYAIEGDRKLFLTGTPIPNRVKEIYPLLEHLDPATFSDRAEFMRKFSSASPSTPWGRKALEDLNVMVRSTVMVRRLKEEVLTDLPPKMRQVIEFSGEGAEAVVERERNAAHAFEERMHDLRVAVELAKASDDPGIYTEAVRLLRAGMTAAFSEISKLRHDTALVKVPMIVEHLKTVLAEGAPVVLFAHHHDVIRAYQQAFPKVSVVLTGENTLLERDAAVRRFQAGEAQLFIGGIQAAGVGLTLTKSSHVAFAEMDWVPGNMTQAEDRCHRIGQKDSVLVQHLVLEGSLDATMAKTLVAKQEVIDAALDSDRLELSSEPIVPTLDEPATTSATKAGLAREASRMAPEDIGAVHRALQLISELCDGARAQDGTGFNKVDAAIGKALAAAAQLTPKQAALGRRIVRKYRRQLPEAMRRELGEKEEKSE